MRFDHRLTQEQFKHVSWHVFFLLPKMPLSHIFVLLLSWHKEISLRSPLRRILWTLQLNQQTAHTVLYPSCCCSVSKLCPALCNTMDCNTPASSVYVFPRQEYWSGLPFPSPGDLPNPKTEPTSLALGGCCSVTKSCPALCNSMDCNKPGFPVLHYLPESAQIHVHWVGDDIQLSHISSSVVPFSFHLLPFPVSGSFPVSWLLASDGQSIGASVSASVLPMNVQGWFPLGLTGLISLQSEGLSGVFLLQHQFKSINSSALSLLYGSSLTSIHDYWKNHSFDYTDLRHLRDVYAF